MRDNVNIIVREAIKSIKDARFEGTTTLDTIISYFANRMAGEWIAQRFSKKTLVILLKNDANKLNAVQKANITKAVDILSKKVSRLNHLKAAING